MRIAVLIIGLLLGAVMFLQTFLVNVLSQAGNDTSSEEAAAVGIMMSLLWLVACALILPFPIFSVVLFGIAGILGFALSGNFPDLAIWGGISFFLAILAFFGWLGKRKERREKRAEQARQIDRDARMESLLQQRSGGGDVACSSCGKINPVGTRFCGNCGTALASPIA